ncbi:Xylose import ATP-binding protein XylG [subsurface metagenome]
MESKEKYLLKMEHVSKNFYGNKVLKNINVSVRPGEIIGLVGENGAGKSTLMNILFGDPIIHETGGFEGKIIFDGKEVNFSSPLDAINAGIGMVHQEFIFIPGFTTTENILLNKEPTRYNFFSEIFGDKLNVLNREEMKKRAIEAIKMLEIELDPEMMVKEMPVGYKQFIEIAREIDRKSMKLLVLDEPTAVLTESEADIVMKAIKKLAAKGISIIFISHRLQEILDSCDRIVVLRDGSVQKELIPSETNPREVAEYMIGRELTKDIWKFKEIRKFNETILEVNNLWVDMPGEQVNGTSFEVNKGEIFGIGGLTGQGKLGIANGIMGLYPAEGEVKFKGKSIHLNNPKYVLEQGIAFVSEDRRGLGLLLDQPIFGNITFTAMQIKDKFLKSLLGGLIKWCDDKAMIKISREYIDALQIKCVSEKQLARELSGGNQQKLCMAKVFVLKPELIFVSEPTRGIDVGAKSLVLDTLCQYNSKYGITIIVASSELEELRTICERIAIVDEGQIAGILPSTVEPTEFGLLMLGIKSKRR